jgi:large subunit ribosomal protein L6
MPQTETLTRSLPIPEGVTVRLDGRQVTVQGPLGTLQEDLSHLPVTFSLANNEVRIETRWPRKREIGMLGTALAHVRNMMKGVTQGYQYNLRTVYAHFPVTVKVDDKTKRLRIENFTGEKTPRFAKISDGVKVEIKGEDISVHGIDLKKVSQTAANIQDSTKIKKKDLRVFLDGIYIADKGPIQHEATGATGHAKSGGR